MICGVAKQTRTVEFVWTLRGAMIFPPVALNRGWSYREQVGPENSGQTVLAYLTATRLHSTEQEWAARLERGEVEVEGARVRRDAVVFAGQMVCWHRPPWDEAAHPG